MDNIMDNSIQITHLQSVSQSVSQSDSQSVNQSVIELPDWDTMSTHVFSVILLGSTASDPGKNADRKSVV